MIENKQLRASLVEALRVTGIGWLLATQFPAFTSYEVLAQTILDCLAAYQAADDAKGDAP